MTNEPTQQEIQEWLSRRSRGMMGASRGLSAEAMQSPPELRALASAGAAQSHDAKCYNAWMAELAKKETEQAREAKGPPQRKIWRAITKVFGHEKR